MSVSVRINLKKMEIKIDKEKIKPLFIVSFWRNHAFYNHDYCNQ